ncbi:DUF4129 domain-containing protein [Thermococcus sp.]
MSTKAKFIALLTLTIVTMSLLMNSHTFLVPSRKLPEEQFNQLLDLTTVAMMVGVFSGLVLILVLSIYIRDRYAPKPKRSIFHVFSRNLPPLIFAFVMMMAFRHFSKAAHSGGEVRTWGVAQNVTVNASNYTENYTSFFYSKPLATANGTMGPLSFSDRYLTHIWVVFLIPMIAVFVYLGYYYYKLGMAELKRKRKIEMARSFDRQLDEFGLEKFRDPREAIVEIYKNAVLWLEGLGIPYRESWTHWEHAEHVRYMHEVFVDLAKLFEKAKYAPERVGWDDAERALEIYNRLRGKANEILGG